MDPALAQLELAVVGHMEWVSFVAVEQLPQAGVVQHASAYREEPAGAGAVAAVQLAQLTGRRVHFFTALGRDATGEQAAARLQQLGLELHVAWRASSSRRGVSFVDRAGERSITVIGERLSPQADDPLPWSMLAGCDGVFVTAADGAALQHCRRARVLTATPLASSTGSLSRQPGLRIATEGAQGGWSSPGGRYAAEPLQGPVVDSYGCGDSFAAGVTAGLAAGWSAAEAIALGARCGAACAGVFGPYQAS